MERRTPATFRGPAAAIGPIFGTLALQIGCSAIQQSCCACYFLPFAPPRRPQLPKSESRRLPAVWISEANRERGERLGYTVVDSPSIIATHLTEIVRNNAYDLLGRQDVQHLMDNLSKTSPKAVEELVPNLLSIGIVQKVLQNLLRDGISVIRPISSISIPMPDTPIFRSHSCSYRR